MTRSKRVKRTMRTVALFKLKGGIGATTTVANLVSAFDDLGHRVAALDLDPQRSLSSWARLGEGILSRTVEPVAEAGELAGKVADKQRGGTEVLLLDAPPGFVDAGLAAALLDQPQPPRLTRRRDRRNVLHARKLTVVLVVVGEGVGQVVGVEQDGVAGLDDHGLCFGKGLVEGLLQVGGALAGMAQPAPAPY
jgi:hypothetical protein